MLYLKGYTPTINYEYKTWEYKESLEKVTNLYIKKIKTIREIDKYEEEIIKEFLMDISNNGYIEEKIESTIGTLIWRVE